MDFTDKRLSYEKGELKESFAPENPFDLLKFWLNEAVEHDVPEPYAMSLGTCGSDKMPAVRIVLMREITATGIVFYTNYLSAKGQDIEDNPQAESLFFWHDMQRQVRVRGNISKIERSRSDAYFQKRPYESQIGAWASQPQSGTIESRAALEEVFNTLKAQYPQDSDVPTPDFWGGYEITIDEIEFWQGRPNRLHDRLLYTKAASSSKTENGSTSRWSIERLKP